MKEEPAGVNVTGGVSLGVALNPLIWLLWFLDFLVWAIYFLVIGWLFALINVISSKAPGKQLQEGQWRAAYLESEDLLTSPKPDTVKTAWDCFQNAFTRNASVNCMGTREYLGEWRLEEGHKIVKKVFGETTWRTYGEIEQRAKAFGRGLVALGMVPSPSKSKAEFEASSNPDTLLLWEDTCADWMTCTAGAFSQSLVVATSYSTLGPEGVAESVTQCECPVVVCNRKAVAGLLAQRKNMPAELKERLSTIIYTDLNCGGGLATGPLKNMESGEVVKPFDIGSILPNRASLPNLADEISDEDKEGCRIINFEDVVAMGNSTTEKTESGVAFAEIPLSPPSPNTMAVVMYTSGSTGKPKGVVIAHKNLCASVAGMHSQFSTWGKEGEETYIAYLPAAHILELVAEIGMLSFGASIGYADPRSIASSGACRYTMDGKINFLPSLAPGQAPGAVQEFKPSCMAAVPKIWDIFKKTVEAQVKEGSFLSRSIFEAAFCAVRNGQSWRYCPLLNLLFTKKVGAVVGGRMKVGISGGGPLSREVQSFCRTAFGFPLIQGYALTETTCAGSVQLISDSDDGIVGAPIPSVEIKLENCPDVNDPEGKPYMTSDTVHRPKTEAMPCKGRGEVLIRGPSVSLGYYARGDQAESLNKKTAEEFGDIAANQDEHHWFHTGDIGLFTTDGRLRLIDRKKNLVKLKGGEYVAIEQMEAVFGTSVYVDARQGGIMCYGDGDIDRPIALVQAEAKNIEQLAQEKGIQGTHEELCNNPEIVKAVLDDMKRIGKGKVAKNEMLGAIALIPGTGPDKHPGNNTSPWTPENGFLTASNKIDRNSIKHGKEIGGVTSDCFDSIIQGLRSKVGGAGAGDTQT